VAWEVLGAWINDVMLLAGHFEKYGAVSNAASCAGLLAGTHLAGTAREARRLGWHGLALLLLLSWEAQ